MRLLIFFVWIAGLKAEAQSSDFANCSLSNEQVKRLNEGVTNDLRVRAAQSIMSDLDILRPQLSKNTSGYPSKLIRVCYDQKRNAMEAIFINGNAALLGSFDFLMAAGRYFFYERAWEAAYRAYEQAAKLQPRMIEPNFYSLQTWNVWQLSSKRTVGQDAYLRMMRKYIEAMNNAKDVKPEYQKIMAEYLADFNEKTNLVYTARKQFEQAVKLDDSNLRLKLNWGTFEERAGRFDDAKRIFEDALAKTSADAENQKYITLRLLRIYKLQGFTDKFAARLKLAQAQFPKDKDFKLIEANTSERIPATKK